MDVTHHLLCHIQIRKLCKLVLDLLVDGLERLELLSLQLLVLAHAGHGGVVCCLYLHSMSEMVWFLLSHYSDSYLVGKSIFKTTFPPPLHQQNFRR